MELVMITKKNKFDINTKLYKKKHSYLHKVCLLSFIQFWKHPVGKFTTL